MVSIESHTFLCTIAAIHVERKPALKTARRHNICNSRRSSRYLIPLLLAVALPAMAQTPPDAGGLQRETERSARPPTAPAAPPAIAAPMPAEKKGVQVTVKRFVVEGATLIPAAELAALLADRIGQTQTLAELEHAAQRIAEHYRRHGWFVRAYLPAQDVTDGIVRIQVVEGRFGGSRLDETPGATRADAAFVQRMVTGTLTVGEPLPAGAIEQGLLRANDLPGIRATGILEAGEQAGETRLLLKVEDTPFITGDLGASNYGSKATGRAQGIGGIALNNLTGFGDRLSLRGLAAEDLASVAVNYSLPLGTDGWRLGAHASSLHYRLGDRFRALDADGDASTWGATLSWAWLRTQQRNLAFSARAERRDYADDMLDAALRRHRVEALTLSADGDFVDGLGGGAHTTGSLQLVSGRLDLRRVDADIALDQAGPKSEGRYTKLALRLARNQTLGRSLSLQATLSGQLADRNLGSSEKFSLGGPYGVRAYPINEAAGDHGWLLNLELRRELGHGFVASLFYDVGQVRLHHDTWAGWQGGGDTPNRYTLDGAGLGLSWSGSGGWLVTAAVAAPLGSNPGRDARNDNNDGSDHRAVRGWLSLNKFF